MVPHPSRKFLGILQIQYCLEACTLLGSKSRKNFTSLVSGCFTTFCTPFPTSVKSVSQISLSICEVPCTGTQVTKIRNKEKCPPWPQLKDTVDVHLGVKPAALQHLSYTPSNHQADYLVVLKCPFLQPLKAGSFEELNNQNFLNVCYVWSVDSSDVTEEKLPTNWTELRVSQER